MIRSFRNRGLERFFLKGETRYLKQDQVVRIRRILGVLDTASKAEDVNLLPGMRLHQLSGNLAGFWSVSVFGNWRITFSFKDGDAWDVDLLDYH